MRLNNQNENLNISSWYYSYSTFRTRIIILSKKYSFRTFINSSNSATVPEKGLKMRLGVLSSYFWSRTIQKRRMFWQNISLQTNLLNPPHRGFKQPLIRFFYIPFFICWITTLFIERFHFSLKEGAQISTNGQIWSQRRWIRGDIQSIWIATKAFCTVCNWVDLNCDGDERLLTTQKSWRSEFLVPK